jgi:hypothetical protein
VVERLAPPRIIEKIPLKTYAKLVGLDTDILSDHRWEAFSESIKIRNRVTHPKFHTEIDISDAELKLIDDGWRWWKDTLSKIIEAHKKRLFGSSE